MKKILLILAILTSGIASAQEKIDATRAYNDLKPVRVFLTSTQQYAFIAQVDSIGSKKYGMYLTSDLLLSERLIVDHDDSVIVLEGTIFEPLSQFTKKQWRKLEKEIKIKFPYISQEILSGMKFYFLFNYDVWSVERYDEKVKIRPKPTPTTTPTNTKSNSSGSGRPPR